MIKNELKEEMILALTVMATLDEEITEVNTNIKDSSYQIHSVDLNSFRQIKQMMKSWLQRLEVSEKIDSDLWDYAVARLGGLEKLQSDFENRPKPVTLSITLDPKTLGHIQASARVQYGFSVPLERLAEHIVQVLQKSYSVPTGTEEGE